ncbi:MAG TPA: hypothetical protein VNZ48_11910, partial [Xanthobacteraceae bacterium]|nr:hypothetical protein [Xanthobacteraceae bacterium]
TLVPHFLSMRNGDSRWNIFRRDWLDYSIRSSKAGTQRICRCLGALVWIPAFAGMSGKRAN